MTLTPQDFVSKWKRVTAREKQSSSGTFHCLVSFRGTANAE